MNGQKLKLDVMSCALAFANASAIVWSFVAILIAFMPEFATKLMAHTTHLADEQFIALTVISFITGFIIIWFYAFILGGLFAWFYNKSSR